jgi:acetolactate synthase-1/2/3 large subunit
VTTEKLPRQVDEPVGIAAEPGRPIWGSDLVMEMLRRLDIEYAAVLPGSTFRGIHDSAVNYTGNTRPELLLCNHEMICVSAARGYARASGRPMVAMLHDLVGLLNAGMTIYDAWCDRSPVIIVGGTGPMDATARRPWIDWIHTANVQGAVFRDFTKWDDQPASLAAIPESLLRAYRVAVTEPAGPVYVCFDVGLQEALVPEDLPALPEVERYRPAAPPAPDAGAVDEAARRLVGAELPLAFAGSTGRQPGAVAALVELAEMLAMPVADTGSLWTSFPTGHDLDLTGDEGELVAQADVVLLLDSPNAQADLRGARPYHLAIGVSLDELATRGLTADQQQLQALDVPILAGPGATLPLLLEACRERLDSRAAARIAARRETMAGRRQALVQRQLALRRAQWDRPQISELRLLAEVWAAVREEDYVFTNGRLRRMGPGMCEVPGPERDLGGGGGAAVGAHSGVALGAALALRPRAVLPVGIVGDGDLLGSIQVLWTAAHYGIPSLWVVNNNRSYFNDEAHQEVVARARGRPMENRWIAQRLENPTVDFCGLARSLGVEAQGPIKDASELRPALSRAVDAVKHGSPFLLDVWTENRS